MDSSTGLPQLTTPMDAMYLIHKALRAEVQRVEEAVEHLEVGGSFKPFQRVFYRWALALNYHVEMEDQYLTPCLPQMPLAQEQKAGQYHLLSMLEALQTYLHDDLGRMIVIPRTRRQLRGKVIALRIAQDDLLEEEEMAVLPVLRQHLSTEEQWALMQRLLIDEDAAEQTAVVDWVAQDLSAPEQQWLADLIARSQAVPAYYTPLAACTQPARQKPEPETSTRIDSPIDVMYSIHKALRAEAAAAEAVVRRLPTGESCQSCVESIRRWATALEYHAVIEDTYITASLDRPAARTNEAEHKQLTELLTDLQSFLHATAAQATMQPRTLRHLLGKVVALQVAQDDHLEEEEERLLPIIRQHSDEAQQLAMARRLLMDQTARNRRWVVDWLSQYATATERQWLAALTARFAEDSP